MFPKLADMALPPTCTPDQVQVFINAGGIDGGHYACQSASQSAKTIITGSFFLITFYYYLATLIFELPILYFLGFRSKKAICWVLIANFFTVFCFHYLAVYFLQIGKWDLAQGFKPGFIIAEFIVTFVEIFIYILALRKQIPIRTIVVATILANLSSALIGGLIVNNLFGGFNS